MINHSIDTGNVSTADYKAVGALAETFFHTQDDPEQLPGTEITSAFFQQFPYAGNIVKSDHEVIGHTFVLPCNSEYMGQFLRKEINERVLFYAIRDKVTPQTYDALYLVSAQIIPAYQRQGIASEGLIKQIHKYEHVFGRKLTLFAWPTTPEGQSLTKKLSATLKRDILVRI